MSSDSNSISVYTDAARDDSVCGLGYVIVGEVDYSGRKFMLGHYTSMEAEYHALIEGLRQAQRRSDEGQTVTLYTDCEPLCGKMRAPCANSEDWRNYRRGFHWLANKFDDWELIYVSRGNNSDAHELAREALFEGREL